MSKQIVGVFLSGLVGLFVVSAEALTPVTVAVPPLVTKRVSVPAAVKPLLANKPRYQPATVKARLSTGLKPGLVALTQANGSRRFVEPASDEPMSPDPIRLAARRLDPALVGMDSYIRASSMGSDRARPASTLVSLQSQQTPVRNQRDRGTCVAFATVAALEAIFMRHPGRSLDLSEEHFFHNAKIASNATCQTPGVPKGIAVATIQASRICTEAQMPYQESANVPAVEATHVPAACVPTYKAIAGTTLLHPSDGGVEPYTTTNTNYIEAVLRSGSELVCGFHVAGSDWTDETLQTGVVDVEIDEAGDPAESVGAHVMLVVGYNWLSQYFIIKNSWGTDSGHEGYVHMSYDYFRTYVANCFYLEDEVAAP